MPEINELQQKRADNLIWNSAGSYGFRPDFKAYDEHGLADVYWNTIIGSARKHYDYPQFERLFQTLDSECQNIFWCALEKLIFPLELPERPVLCLLRCESDSPLALSPGMTTEEIVAAAETFFRFYCLGRTPKKKLNIPGLKKKKASSYRSFLQGSLWHPEDAYSGGSGSDPLAELATKLSEEELRLFMETKFGKSIFSPVRTVETERELCSGAHASCHLLFTNGEREDISKIQNGFEALSRQREAAQQEENRAFYNLHITENTTAISKLSANIRNSVLLHLQPAPVKSYSGTLNGEKVWRAPVLNDGKVFLRAEQENLGDFCVDILLDSSTSQSNRCETISSQAFIIAESLKRCSIPCRVMSFCSMTGYTILRIYQKNEDIFSFTANGCNRDGLAIRAARSLMENELYAHKMLIIISYVKPNDVVIIKNGDDSEPVPYEKKAGLSDTAFEVRRARADGISVICIFTGNDEDLPSASMVYGNDFVRIKSFEYLADTVGKLIKNQIKNM